jgi:hypothetical protein
MTDKSETKPTRSQAAATDVTALLRARNPLLWIVTREEARVEDYLIAAAKAAKLTPRMWDVAQGVTDADGTRSEINALDPDAVLEAIRDRAIRNPDRRPERGLWVLRDFGPWLAGPAGAATTRRLRNLTRLLPTTEVDLIQAVVVLTTSREVPAELSAHATVIDWPLPDRAEIAAILDATVAPYAGVDPLKNGSREAAVDAAVGLTGEEAQACYAKSLVQLRRVDPAAVAQEKRRVVAREGLLQWFDPLPGGLDSVGGLDQLKTWLVERASAWTPAAKAYGLQSPKGMLLVGISGCGKSLLAKATSTAYMVPLLRLDMGALKNMYVGKSEENLRKAIGTVEAIGRCVLWIDEVEKAMAGATQGAADGGVAADSLGFLLSWMQERKGECFIVATANDVRALPPEFLRKGRFDEIWWVDLPTFEERSAVLAAALRTHGRDADKLGIDMPAVAAACDQFTGAEIAAIVPDAMFAGFADNGREITTEDLLRAAATVAPLSKTAGDKIAEMRKWADGKARPATSKTEAKRERRVERVLDI